MSEHAPKHRLDLQLVPADGPPDSIVLNDLIQLIKQGIATASRESPKVADAPFHEPDAADEAADVNQLEARIKNRIEQASAASQADVQKRAEIAKQPDAADKLAEQSRLAAERVVAAVQRAILRGVAVRVPDA